MMRAAATTGPASPAGAALSAGAVSAAGSVSAAEAALLAGTALSAGTVPAGGLPVRRRFTRRVDEVPVARRFIRDVLAGDPSSLDAELLACELVTNAVQHATDAAGVTVAVSRRGAVVHVDVTDDGRSGLLHWRETDGQDESGRGFHLVNEIAQRWGFLREQAGTCVWFELDPE
jgi:anti-sigma regulatory factor (Ser/Thr protein kinase)